MKDRLVLARRECTEASQWVDRLAGPHHDQRVQDELVRLGRHPLLVR